MKKLIENFIIIMVLTIAILFSYALIEKKISGRSSSEFINFLFSLLAYRFLRIIIQTNLRKL